MPLAMSCATSSSWVAGSFRRSSARRWTRMVALSPRRVRTVALRRTRGAIATTLRSALCPSMGRSQRCGRHVVFVERPAPPGETHTHTHVSQMVDITVEVSAPARFALASAEVAGRTWSWHQVPHHMRRHHRQPRRNDGFVRGVP